MFITCLFTCLFTFFTCLHVYIYMFYMFLHVYLLAYLFTFSCMCVKVFSDVVNGKGAQKTSPLSRTSHREFSNDDRDLEYKKGSF